MYKIEGRKAAQLLQHIANKVFKQNWIVKEEKENSIGEVDGYEMEDNGDNDEPDRRKSRRSIGDLDYVLPTRSMVKTYALLSFTGMAERIQDAKRNKEIVTYGVNDIVKAA